MNNFNTSYPTFKTEWNVFIKLLTCARPNTLKLILCRFPCAFLPVKGRRRISTRSCSIHSGSPTRIITLWPLTPFGPTAINCHRNKLYYKFLCILESKIKFHKYVFLSSKTSCSLKNCSLGPLHFIWSHANAKDS